MLNLNALIIIIIIIAIYDCRLKKTLKKLTRKYIGILLPKKVLNKWSWDE